MQLHMFADFTDAIPLEKRLALIKDNGFDGVMLGFSEKYRYSQYELADRADLSIQNVHSPFDRMNALWEKRDDSNSVFERTAECIRVCAANNVKKVIVHPTDGLIPPPVSAFGINNFDKLISLAANYGVKLLFENIQLPKFLDVMFDEFGQSENVGLCYDVGHENCFAKGDDCLSRHGRLLEALHIHDNDGMSDGHMIPFDGNIIYEGFLEKVKSLNYSGALSLEVYMTKSPLYRNVSPEDFAAMAKQSADKLNEIYERI